MNGEILQVYEGEKAMIDSQIATAKAYPRNIQKFLDNSITTVTSKKDIAESCVYTVPRGNGKISGPSVNMAKIAMQFFGNFRAGARVVEIENKTLTSEAIAFDIENNVSVKIQVKRSIFSKNGRFSDDMIVITGNAANSIALRNAIYAVIPKVFIDQIYAAAQKKIVGDVGTEEKLIAARVKTMQALKDRYSVTEKEILSAIGKEAIEHITKDDLVTFAGIDTAIKEGDTTVDQAFRGKIAEAALPKEDRVILVLGKCETIQQLESFKANLKTNEQRSFYEDCYQKLKNKTKTQEKKP
jgi:molybdopterin converting factor small subunit